MEQNSNSPLTSEPEASVLLLDDEPNVLSSLRRALRPVCKNVFPFTDPEQALAHLKNHGADCVISDMRMPLLSGDKFLAQARQICPGAPRMLLTGYSEIEASINAINEGGISKYISKPWNDQALCQDVLQAIEQSLLRKEKARLDALLANKNRELAELNAGLEAKVAERSAELKSANERLRSAFLNSLRAFSGMIASRFGSTERAAALARQAAIQLNLAPEQADNVFFAGLICKAGMLHLPDSIAMQDPRRMSPADFAQYARYPSKAREIFLSVPELAGAVDIAAAVCEHYDGSGFPLGLKGYQIPPEALALRASLEFCKSLPNKPSQADYERAAASLASLKGNVCCPAAADAVFAARGMKPARANAKIAPISSLAPGMRLAKDLRSENGSLLLAQGQTLTDKQIAYLRQMAAARRALPDIWIAQP